MRNLEISLPRRQDVEFIPDKGNDTQAESVIQEGPLKLGIPAKDGTFSHSILGKISVRVSQQPPHVEVEGEGIGKFSEPIMLYSEERDATKRFRAAGQTENGTQITVTTPEVYGWESKHEIPVYVAKKHTIL